MNYEKKYREAIERAKEILEYSKKPDSKEVRMVLSFFPELAESEDERIRNALMQNLKERFGTKGNMGEGLDMPDVLAWLEKQGEPADKIKPKFKVGDKIVSAFNTPYYITKVCDRYYLTDVGRIIMFNAQDNFELAEQNPAWSEEDEAGLGDAMWAIEQARTIAKDENDMGNLWYAEHWLKSLKERVQPQPKQEWSEEDENLFEEIKRCVGIQYPLGNPCIFKFLKSLKDRYTLKPSDEQMKVLNEVLNFAANHESPHWNDYIFGTLNNLIRQLKN